MLMGKAIFKYTLDADRSSDLLMPVGAKILHVHGQNDEMCVWAIVDPDAPMETRKFSIYGTGHPMNDEPEVYIGSLHIFEEREVYHVFERVLL